MFSRPFVAAACLLSTMLPPRGGVAAPPAEVPTATGEVSAATVQVTDRAFSRADLDEAVQDPEGPLAQTIARLEESVTRRDASVFDAFLNGEWLLKRVIGSVDASDLGATDDVRTAFATGTRNSWRGRSLVTDYLGHHFRFLHSHTVNGRHGLLFRASGDNNSLNYCVLTVARGPGGEWAADDVYVVGVGEFASDTLRRGYLTLVEALNPVNESGRRAALYIDELPRILELNKAMAQKDYDRVFAIAALLPPVVRQERNVLLMRLEAAEKISLAEHSRVFAEWRSLHPDPLQLPLKSADFALATGNFAEAAAITRRLDESIGGDSYLKVRLGEIAMLQRHQTTGIGHEISPASTPNTDGGRVDRGR